MSWQLASFAVTAAVLAAGFAWYERSRPPAKVLSLVAALAALATVGRIAFAPIPNVKPTTDIALFAGYALGPVPGFAVGALAGLASNFFFGQGPWTPWQMLGWGLAGIIGGLLRKVAGPGLGRAPLAVVCGLAGAAFGALMDLYQWTQGATHDLPAYLAWSATSLPYNVAHVVGNVAFCLLLGPTFVRALSRFRRRFEVRWAPAAAAVLVALAVAGSLAGAPRAEAAPSATARAVAYLQRAQNGDGGFGAAPGASSTQLHTGWAALGLAGAGVNPLDVRNGGNNALDFMRGHAGALTDIGDIERTILALRAIGASPRSFGGRDLVAALLRRRSRNGSWKKNTTWTSFGILALKSAGGASVSRSARWLAQQQNRDGGFGFAPRAASSIDDTGAAMEALGAAGRGGSRPARRAVAFLRRVQVRDGGFPLQPGQGSNSQSTSWALQGLIGVGRGPRALRRSPLRYLRSLQGADGSIRYSRFARQTPVWTTAQALDALAGKAFPLKPAPKHSRLARRTADGNAAPAATKPPPAAGKPRRNSGAAGKQPAPAPAPAATTPAAPAPTATAARTAAVTREHGGSGGFAWGAAVAAAALAAIAAFAVWRLARRRALRPN